MIERIEATFEFKSVEDVPLRLRAVATAILFLLKGLDYDDELSVLTSLMFDTLRRLHAASDGMADPDEIIEEVTAGLHAMWARYQLAHGVTKQ
jgi:hypothetical protein